MNAFQRVIFLAFATSISNAVFASGADDSSESNFIGAGGWLRPTYDGGNSHKIVAIPEIDYQHKQFFITTTQDIFEAGVKQTIFKGLTVGLQLANENGRDSNESTWLGSHNVTSLPSSVSWGGQMEFNNSIGPMPFWILARYRQNTNANFGAQEDLRISVGVYGGQQLQAGLFAQATWADKNSMERYYGITAQESSTTGLATFTPDAGRLYNSGGVIWEYDFSHIWKLVGSMEAHYLQAAVSNSPLVSTNVNYYASLGLVYAF
jgi:outer membrane scaffolding protein for murein synthesis (MipA/OmpV family)